MMSFKNHNNGFTLIEVLLALAIVAIMLTPLFITFGMVMERVNWSSRSFDALLLCKDFLLKSRQKQDPQVLEFSQEKQDKDFFDANLTYSLKKISEKQGQLGQIEGLLQETITISWQDQGQKKQEKLVTYVYKKPEQKKK